MQKADPCKLCVIIAAAAARAIVAGGADYSAHPAVAAATTKALPDRHPLHSCIANVQNIPIIIILV